MKTCSSSISSTQAGFTLMEMLLSIVMLGLIATSCANLASYYFSKYQQGISAERILRFSKALKAYVLSEHDQILLDLNHQTHLKISAQTLSQAGFLHPSMTIEEKTTPICGILSVATNKTIKAYSVWDSPLDDVELSGVVSLLGVAAGAVYHENEAMLLGYNRAWQDQSQPYRCDSSAVSGNVVYALMFDHDAEDMPWLSRIELSERPQANAMQTSLNMNDFSILNANSITAKEHIYSQNVVASSRISAGEYVGVGGLASIGEPCESVGLLATDSSQSLLICQHNQWQAVSSSAKTPSEMIAYFNASSCPDGWRIADGTNETVDMRGVFVRGLDHSRGLDQDRELASLQNDAIRNITGTYSANQLATNNASPVVSGAFYSAGAATTSAAASGSGKSMKIGFNAARVVNVANENRPINVALLACQKI